MLDRIRTGEGFLAALDQSGGSTPKALELYGVPESAYSDDSEMFDLIHRMRTRIVTSPAFTGERILGAILFEQTMDRQIDGLGSAEYLWTRKHIVPFLKVDRGLEEVAHGAQTMKPIAGLEELLARANEHGVFGTKMRSVINRASQPGIAAIVAQQFEVADQISAHGLMPIIEPEISIKSPDKAACEALLRDALLGRLDALPKGTRVMLKLTLPETPDFYMPLIKHAGVARVVALSGGYTRADACRRLAANHGMIASFSRALTEGLTRPMSDAGFDTALAASIDEIYGASAVKA